VLSTSTGYVYERIPYHPIATKNGTVLQHRKIWFDANGTIPDGFVIHHINGDKTDNCLENLELCSRSEHMKKHYPNGFCSDAWNKGKTEWLSVNCDVCGKIFTRFAKEVRKTRKRNQRTVCSIKCRSTRKNSARGQA